MLARALLPERPGSLISLLRRALGRAQPDSLWDDEDPIRSELFSVERLEQHAESLAANQPISTTPASGPGRSSTAWPRTNAPCSTPIADLPRPLPMGARSHRRRNGCSTISTWSKNRFAKSATTCRRDIIGNCPSSQGPSRDIRACSASPGISSPTPTAGSTRNPDAFHRAYQTRPSPYHRRAVGDRNHFAHHAGGESAPRPSAYWRTARSARAPTPWPTY